MPCSRRCAPAEAHLENVLPIRDSYPALYHPHVCSQMEHPTNLVSLDALLLDAMGDVQRCAMWRYGLVGGLVGRGGVEAFGRGVQLVQTLRCRCMRAGRAAPACLPCLWRCPTTPGAHASLLCRALEDMERHRAAAAQGAGPPSWRPIC